MCIRDSLYCSFSSSPIGIWKDQVDAYLDALCKEIDYASEAFADKELNTVYIGGGTPTTLEPAQLDRLLTKLEERFDYSRLREFTVEAGRPDSITAEKLQVLRDHGISRISVNPQTMNQKTLDLIGRKHTVEQTKEAFFLARTLGFDNINMDLFVGLPGEGQPEVEHTMREITALDPDSITAVSYTHLFHFSWYGWMNVHTAAVICKESRVMTNRMGRGNAKFMKNIRSSCKGKKEGGNT